MMIGMIASFHYTFDKFLNVNPSILAQSHISYLYPAYPDFLLISNWKHYSSFLALWRYRVHLNNSLISSHFIS